VEVRRELVLPSPLEEVWAALTDAQRLAGWFANEVELEPERGGRGRFRWSSGEVRRALVEEFDPPRRLVFRWRSEDAPLEESRVAFDLEEVPEGTLLVVVESTSRAATPEWSAALGLQGFLDLARR